MALKTTLMNLFLYTSTNPNTLLMTSLSYMSAVTEIAFVFPWNNILLTKLELCKTASIELATTKYSYLNHLISLLYILSQTFKLFFASFTYLGSYSHFYIHVIYLFSIIYFIFTSYRQCSVKLTRDWIISYVSSLLNLRFVYTTLYLTHTLHTYFP